MTKSSITINDPKTGKPLVTVKADTSIKNLILQIEEAGIEKFIEKLRTKEPEISEISTMKTYDPENSQITRASLMDKVKLILSKRKLLLYKEEASI